MLGKTVVVGVCGGIAAYKTCELVSLLKKSGASVHVVMTKNACEFISPLTFETLSGNRVINDMFDRDFSWEVEHVSLAKKADIFVMAPATLNVIGKFANGIGDDFLTTTLFATKCPILFAPGMNTSMLESAAYIHNEKVLQERGCHFIFGSNGRLACGDIGKGRMAEPQDIFNTISEILHYKNDYVGKTVLITAGSTSEAIDPVRFITNRSSGKMGAALANAVEARGGKVIFVYGNVSVPLKDSWEKIHVETTKEMLDAVMLNFEKSSIIIKAAAPADYSVEKISSQKIKDEKLTLSLKKNPDIAKSVGAVKGKRKLIIFSAETENLIDNASKKLIAKNADMVVANDVTAEGAGFNVDTNIATIITKSNIFPQILMKKSDLSHIILDKVVELG